MMAHESDGMVQHWTHRDLLCRSCGFDYEQKYGDDSDCPVCYSQDFDILAEYYD